MAHYEVPHQDLCCLQIQLGRLGGAMGLGKLLLPGRPANLDYSRARTSVLAEGAGGGCLDIFSLIYHLLRPITLPYA